MRYHVLVNPASGAGKAPDFVEHRVLPLLTTLGIEYDVHVTKSVDDAARIGRELIAERDQLNATQEPGKMVVVVGGGDGTAHEFMEGVLDGVRRGKKLGVWELITLPLGTANALYSTLFPPSSEALALPPRLQGLVDAQDINALSSLILSLSGGGSPRALPVTQTTISGKGEEDRAPIPSHIVLSTALHANILADSEAYRPTMPGVERFKVAAAANIGVFFPATVRLLPSPSGGVRQYDPRTKGWRSLGNGEITLDGPFAYWLSVTTTPRLEPTFVIAPTLTTLPPSDHEGTMDIVALRPARDPRVCAALQRGEGGAEEWSARAKEVLGAAYDEGRHVSLVYGREGQTEEAKEGQGEVEPVVEVFRCAGFQWTPTDAEHAKSHIVCADGSLYIIPPGGSARAKVLESHEGEGFWVWG